MTNRLIIKTTDSYEIVYYLTHSSTVVEGVEVIPRGKQSICQFALSGEHLDRLQNEYVSHKAVVNLCEFRRLLQQVNVMITRARREAAVKKEGEVKL